MPCVSDYWFTMFQTHLVRFQSRSGVTEPWQYHSEEFVATVLASVKVLTCTSRKEVHILIISNFQDSQIQKICPHLQSQCQNCHTALGRGLHIRQVLYAYTHAMYGQEVQPLGIAHTLDAVLGQRVDGTITVL